MTIGRRQRCAIYTRKSTDEGLDREFNSLDAQREACVAYILSQREQGWVLDPELFDDGGFSGGSLDRPALKQLLTRVQAGQVDIVVVYKVDRLTRSLTDFAKIVQVLDGAGASFVSVTQAFNTTTSMGRLTLNVLLSFAQFEREVITERIRDKIAASKARGMWMGGAVPLGYAAVNRKLVVVPEEAEMVREIMRRYIACESVRHLLQELEDAGIVSKRRTGKDGAPKGGVPFKRGALYWLLSNRLYRGDVSHKGAIYKGEHEAIVGEELFAEVQARLRDRSNPRSLTCAQRVISTVAGMVRDSEGRPMPPTHTQRHGRRYRYYATHSAMVGKNAARRIRADVLEPLICSTLFQYFRDTPAKNPAEISRRHVLDALAEGSPADQKQLFQLMRLEVRVERKQLIISFVDESQTEEIDQSADKQVMLTAELSKPRLCHEDRIAFEPAPSPLANSDKSLRALIARSFAARDELLAMSAENFARQSKTHIRHLERIARLSYLDPGIIRSIDQGTQPHSISARYLSRVGSLPLSWKDQRDRLQRKDPHGS